MPIIQENGPYMVLIEFETDPKMVHQMIAKIVEVVERAFKPDARFISASFHVREDECRAFNYAQWTSEADYKTFISELSHEDGATIQGDVKSCNGKGLGAHAYTVQTVVER